VELAVPLAWLASSWAIALALVLLTLLMSMKVPFVLVVAPWLASSTSAHFLAPLAESMDIPLLDPVPPNPLSS